MGADDLISRIREHMPVVDRHRVPVGVVDRVEGDRLRLTAGDSTDGRHHWIPAALVHEVDDRVHLDRAGDEVMRLWTTE